MTARLSKIFLDFLLILTLFYAVLLWDMTDQLSQQEEFSRSLRAERSLVDSTKTEETTAWSQQIEYMLNRQRADQFELTAVVLLRVNFTKDRLNFTHDEVDQWLTYMEYAGVQHFYMYDNCQAHTECVQESYANNSRVTYIPWPEENYEAAQYSAYVHHLEYHVESQFEIQLDIDEYPFRPNDLEPGFLVRFARNMPVEQTLIPTWFFGGPKDSDHSWRAMRYFHKQEEAVINERYKPLYVPSKVEDIEVHRAWGPSTVETSPDELYLKHYWCERLEEAPVYDDSISPLIEKVVAWDTKRKRRMDHK